MGILNLKGSKNNFLSHSAIRSIKNSELAAPLCFPDKESIYWSGHLVIKEAKPLKAFSTPKLKKNQVEEIRIKSCFSKPYFLFQLNASKFLSLTMNKQNEFKFSNGAIKCPLRVLSEAIRLFEESVFKDKISSHSLRL